jgi:hypothetical protein
LAFTLSRLLNGFAEKYTPALSLWNGTIVGMSEKGLKIAEISETDYRDFASRHATSPEIGPIQTSFDPSVKEKQKREFEQVLVGLWGCDNLCAVADFHIYPSETDSTKRALKLDSVIEGALPACLSHRFLPICYQIQAGKSPASMPTPSTPRPYACYAVCSLTTPMFSARQFRISLSTRTHVKTLSRTVRVRCGTV